MPRDLGKLSGKVALVSGAASGIGAATARLFAAEDATVIVSDVHLEAAESVASEIRMAGQQAEAAALDVSDESGWQRVIAQTVKRHTRLDVVVNNAGISRATPVAESTLDGWRQVMKVNLDGVFLGTKHAILTMKDTGGGSVINVASVSGIVPSAGASAYCASKAAVRIFSKTAAIECADAKTNVRINVVTPAGVKTPMWEKEPFFQRMIEEHGGADQAFAAMAGEIPSHQFFTPDEIAQTILYLASDAASHLTGVEIVTDRRPCRLE